MWHLVFRGYTHPEYYIVNQKYSLQNPETRRRARIHLRTNVDCWNVDRYPLIPIIYPRSLFTHNKHLDVSSSNTRFIFSRHKRLLQIWWAVKTRISNQTDDIYLKLNN